MRQRQQTKALRFRLYLAAVLFCAMVSVGRTQTEDAVGPAIAARDNTREGDQDVKPDIFYLPDENGRLHPVPGFSLKEFRDLWDLKEGIRRPEVAPDFSIPRVDVDGRLDGSHMNLEIAIQAVTMREDWVRLPLGLKPAILTGCEFQGPGEHFIQRESDDTGYVVWIRNTKGKPLKISLKMVASISTAGKVSRLDLSIPKVTTASKVTLRIPSGEISATASQGTTVLPTKAAGSGETILTAVGMAGDFFVSWQPKTLATAKGHGGVEAEGEISLRIQHGSRVEADVKVTLRPRGNRVESLKVRLPRGFVVVPGSAVGCSSAEEEQPKQGSVKAVIHQFVLDEPIASSAEGEIGFSAVWNLEPKDQRTAQNTGVELAGFEIVGALRQSGLMAVSVGDDLQLSFASMKNVIHDDQLPEGVDRNGIRGAFRYLGNRPSLRTKIVPFDHPIRVEPTHRVVVTERNVRLTTRLKYLPGAAKTDIREIRMPGWIVDEVRISHGDFEEVVDIDSANVDPLMVVLPQAMRNRFEIEISATQPLPVDATDFSVVVPRPVGNIVGDAMLVVERAENIALSKSENLSVGLTPQDVTSVDIVSANSSPHAIYRVVDNVEEVEFGAMIDVLPGEVSVDVNAEVTIDDAMLNVSQTFRYDVRHEFARECSIKSPKWLTSSRRLAVTVDNVAVARSAINVVEIDGNFDVMAIPFGASRLGEVVVEVDYSINLSKLTPGQSTPLAIALLTPDEDLARVASFGADVTSQGQIQLALDDARWTSNESPTSVRESLTLVADGPQTELRLETTRVEETISEETIADKLWIQTWLTTNSRQDRATFALMSSADEVSLRLPNRTDLESVQVFVDGEYATIRESANPLRLQLSESSASNAGMRRHVLEVSYRFSDARGKPGSLAFSSPEIVGADWTRECIWQIVLPADEYMLQGPSAMSVTGPNIDKLWTRGHGPAMNEIELGEWLGSKSHVTSNAAKFSSGTNQYFFYGVDRIGELRIYSATRRFILFAGAGLSIVLVVVTLQFSAVARGRALVALLLACLALGLWLPQSAILFGQAGVIGVVFVLISQLVRRYWGSPEYTGTGQATTKEPSSATTILANAVELPEDSAPSTTAAAIASAAIRVPSSRLSQ